MVEINFDCPKAEKEKIKKIVKLAMKSAEITNKDKLDKIHFDKTQIYMSVVACHCNGCPLDLDRLLNTEDDFSRVHDVFGIHNTVSRETGKLTNHFLPRFHKREKRA